MFSVFDCRKILQSNLICLQSILLLDSNILVMFYLLKNMFSPHKPHIINLFLIKLFM